MSNQPPRGFMSAATILTAGGDAWEERLRHWSRPATGTEEATIERAARMVRNAIEADRWMQDQGVEVFPQGSYFNNTNVRVESDMDIRIVHPLIHVVYDETCGPQARNWAERFYNPVGVSSNDVAAEMRTQTSRVLRGAFDDVDPGKKAFRIPLVRGSRSDIDVAPTMRLNLVTPTMRGRSFIQGPAMDAVEGIALFDSDGRLTRNFPQQHHDAGKAKWRATGHWFKKVVRQLKKMKDHLVAEDKLKEGRIPSFLVENLVYNVEDAYFAGHRSRKERFKAVVARAHRQVIDQVWASQALEISGWKPLFGAHAAWKPGDCADFLYAAYHEVT